MTAILSLFNFSITLNSTSTSEVSSDDVGSSKTTICDFMEMALAIETICCMAVPKLESFAVTSNKIPIDFKILSASL